MALMVISGFLLGISTPLFGAAWAADNTATAKDHYETGTRFFELGEYRKALEEYKAAYMAKPDPAFLFNIGQCHRKLAEPQKAIEFFQQYLKKGHPNDVYREQVEGRIRELEVELLALSNANQNTTNQSPKAGSPKISEPPVPTVPSVDSSLESVTAEPRPTDRVNTSSLIAASASELSSPKNTPGSGLWLHRTWTWVAAGSSLMFTGGAIVFGMAMQSKFESLRRSCGSGSAARSGCSDSEIDSVSTRKNVANILWAFAGATMVTTVVLFYFEDKSIGVAPVVGKTIGFTGSMTF
jgi:hypothetical protein